MKTRTIKNLICLILCVCAVFSLASCQFLKFDFDNTDGETEQIEIPTNNDYTILSKDGKCYLAFNDPTPYENYEPDRCIVITETESYDSPSEMKAAIMGGNMDSYRKYYFSKALSAYSEEIFINNKKYTAIEIADLYNLYTPAVPDDIKLESEEVGWGNYYYSYALKKNGAITVSAFNVCSHRYFFDTYYAKYVKILSDTTYQNTKYETGYEEDRNATVFYSVEGEQLKKLHVVYALETGYKALTVIENYTNSAAVPSSVEILGYDKYHYFYANAYGFSERPTEEWLLSFGLTPYTE